MFEYNSIYRMRDTEFCKVYFYDQNKFDVEKYEFKQTPCDRENINACDIWVLNKEKFAFENNGIDFYFYNVYCLTTNKKYYMFISKVNLSLLKPHIEKIC